jgi:uncharacterized damage-inducible protein DinB
MASSLLSDAFAHHIWATDRLLEACAALTPEQLRTPAPGTYGPILATLGHLVGSDGWYLSFFRPDEVTELAEEEGIGLPEMRAAAAANGRVWLELIESGELEPDTDVVEHGEGWDFHAPVALRLAQVIHHGTDHRSQVCTALTSLGIEPPLIDVWDWGEAVGRTKSEYLTKA